MDGWTFDEWRKQLDAMDTLKHALKGLSDDAVMARLGHKGQHPEGWFAPDTYFYTRGTSDLTLLERAMARQQDILNQAWAERDQNLPYSGPYQALIMASIVEKETGVPSERAEIAGVFVNRLRKGMRLQTDPTVIYGMGDRYHGNIRRSDLHTPTPYNTYVIPGLPPTPIAMPGREAIMAAVHPADTEALYFVARGDGSHYFSKTLAEHRKAVRDFQLRRRQGYRSAPGDKQ
ncbi:MAG: endolytic transglycosylase MltG [Alcanivorax sp.]|nr:endolytic transglycosylase MltG [Alcanivorax sp.]